jgi:hypothetical protein
MRRLHPSRLIHLHPVARTRTYGRRSCSTLRTAVGQVRDRPAIRRPAGTAGMLTWVSEVDRQVEVNRRRCNRNTIRCWLRLSYLTPSGETRLVRGRALDASSSGALVQILQPIPLGSCVRVVRGNGLLVGTMYVRFCSRQGWCFKVGLEFATSFADRF